MENDALKEDIVYIKRMIENNRRSLVDNGIMYISIGVFVVIGFTVAYILGINGREDLLPAFWVVLIAVIIAFNIIVQSKFKKKQTKKTFASEIFNATWSACGIPIAVITLINIFTESIPHVYLFIIISTILGIGYYLTGVINELNFMKLLAFGWWIFSIAAIFWKYIGEVYQLSLLFAGVIFILEVVPGIIIYKKWKQLYNE